MKVLPLLLSTLLSLPAQACYLANAEHFEFDDTTSVYLRFTAGEPVIGEHFALALMLCRDEQAWSPARLRIDAIMPAHNHGMNYQPGITGVDTGRYSAQGLLMHMPGIWRFSIEYADGDERGVVEFDHQL